MAKERTSSAFKGFLSGVATVKDIQQQSFQEDELQKARSQAEKLAKLQIDAVASNLRKQLDQSAKQHADTLAQQAKLTEAGFKHAAGLQTDKIKAEVDMHNKTIGAQKAISDLQMKINLAIQTAASYDQARDTQLTFEKQGIKGDITTDEYGFARFKPNGYDSRSNTIQSVAASPKPTPSHIPELSMMNQVARYLDGGIAGLPYNISGDMIAKEGLHKGIQDYDLRNAEAYSEKVADVLSKNPEAMNDPRMILAMDALNKIINRSEYSQQKTQQDITKPASRDIQTYIQYMLNSQNKK